MTNISFEINIVNSYMMKLFFQIIVLFRYSTVLDICILLWNVYIFLQNFDVFCSHMQ